jgi:hypothetical protein
VININVIGIQEILQLPPAVCDKAQDEELRTTSDIMLVHHTVETMQHKDELMITRRKHNFASMPLYSSPVPLRYLS